jgi:EAL domain-containing protein (putative c-di-GMP-specific phosphodiesterase class I)
MSGNDHDGAIVRAIISLAHNLGFEVIAEGVETPEQLEFLREQGCDAMQGHYFSPPVPYAVISQYLGENKGIALN